MSIELREKWESLKEIMMKLKNPATMIMVIWLSILPVGLALMWKETSEKRKKTRKNKAQTKLTDWVE